MEILFLAISIHAIYAELIFAIVTQKKSILQISSIKVWTCYSRVNKLHVVAANKFKWCISNIRINKLQEVIFDGAKLNGAIFDKNGIKWLVQSEIEVDPYILIEKRKGHRLVLSRLTLLRIYIFHGSYFSSFDCFFLVFFVEATYSSYVTKRCPFLFSIKIYGSVPYANCVYSICLT